jgi:hypothetical protein
MNVLINILNNHGMMSEAELSQLATEFPNVFVGIKFGCSARCMVPAKDVNGTIRLRLAQDSEEYVREVFLPCSVYDSLRAALRMPAEG